MDINPSLPLLWVLRAVMGLTELGVEQIQKYGASWDKHPLDAGHLRQVGDERQPEREWAQPGSFEKSRARPRRLWQPS